MDQDYSGECAVIMMNIGTNIEFINVGDRIAQAVLCPVVLPELEEVLELSDSTRGTSGFGSSGR